MYKQLLIHTEGKENALKWIDIVKQMIKQDEVENLNTKQKERIEI